MICPSCGHETPDDSATCNHCHYVFNHFANFGDISLRKFPPIQFSNLKGRSVLMRSAYIVLFAVLFAALLYFGFRFLTAS